MTVGQPETNLNTWGLRYVKKKTATENIEGSTERGERRVGAHSEGSSPKGITAESTSHLSQTDIDVSSHGGRQNDSSGDTVGRHSASGKKIGEQRHEHKQDKQSLVGQKYQGDFTTTGRHEGATAQIGSDESKRLGRDQTRMTASGTKYNTRDQKRPLGVGEGASHESGITSPETRTGKKQQGGDYNPENVKAPKGTGKPLQTQTSPKHKNPVPKGDKSPKIKAALDYAIIKCKLLKMKGIQKDFIEDNKPTRPAFRKEDPEEKKESKTEKPEYTKEEKDKMINEETKKYPMYKSEDIVSKAIELINTAYDEISKHRPTESTYTKEEKDRIEHVSTQGDDQKGEHKWVAGNDPSGKPDEYCKECGKTRTDKDKEGDGGTATTSTEGAFNHVYSDVHEKKKQEKKDKKQDEDDEGEQQAEQEEMEGEAWHSQYD